MFKRRCHLAFYMFLGLFLLFKFQNCAPANLSAANSVAAPDPNFVGIIDNNVHKGTSISFVQSEVAVADRLQVDGMCDGSQNGAILAWRVLDENSSVVLNGTAKCELGGFRISSTSVDQISCDHQYQLKAGFGFDKGDELAVFRDCQ